jgi:hypothetical protein
MIINGSGRRLGDGPGTRALIGVLLLHRTLDADTVIAGMNAALSLDSCDPDLVAVEARRASHPESLPPRVTARNSHPTNGSAYDSGFSGNASRAGPRVSRTQRLWHDHRFQP